MILNNRFKFFNKKGYNLNPDYTNAIVVSIENPGDGLGAIIIPFTNQNGQLWHVEIKSGGDGYTADSFLKFTDIYTGKVYVSDPSQLTLSVTGEILSFSFPYSLTDNQSGFSYPATSQFINQFLEPVSTGLIATDHVYVVENVLDSNGQDENVFPRVNYYGTDPSTLQPFYISEYGANGTAATVKIQTLTVSGNAYVQEPNKISNANVIGATLDNVQEGMYVTGNGIIVGTYVKSIDRNYNVITLSQDITTFGSVSLEIYNPHNLRVGNQIVIWGGTQLDGAHVLTAISPTKLVFDSTLNITTTPAAFNAVRYSVVPIFRAYFAPNSDEEFFLFDVQYNEDYPTINKNKEVYFLLDDGSDLAFPDTLPSYTSNGAFQRQLTTTDLHKSALQINLGLQSDYEGVFTAQFMIDDVTFPVPVNIFTGLYEGETIAEDERFSALLQNFGRDVDRDEELILRESDVYEDNPNYILLNAKRKEMLLEGDNIWPYMGSYKGLVNVVNWFGYYDIRIKEYWLNVNTEDEYYGKYKQMQIPFQLKDKGKSSEAISLLPSLHYKKTNLFGLFYDLVKDGGTFDVAGVPDTVDAFEYSNEEILIKLFALKRYLKEKFLPLNTRIIDIVGEGVYYERYAVNSWNDPVNLLEVNLTRGIDFKASTVKQQIIDIRPYDTAAGLKSPAYFDLVSNYSTRYQLNKVDVSNPGGPYYSIPIITFPGQAKQQARGIVRVRAYATSVTPAVPTGIDYQIGDVITLSGGSYENPIRVTVVNVNGSGAVTEYEIIQGPHQGDNYSSIPTAYFQANVYRIDGAQYIAANATGFTAPSGELPLEVNSVYLYDKGLKYSTYPEIVLSPNNGGTTFNMGITIEEGTPISYFNDGGEVSAFSNYENVPVAAPIDLSTNFDISWDELPYAWKEMGGGADATLKCYVDALPSGTGAILAVEIVSPGNGYRYAPGFLVNGGGGYGGTVTGSIKDGKLKILEYEVQTLGNNIGTNDVITVTPALPLGGIYAVTAGKIVKADGIPEAVIINTVNQGSSQIYLTYVDGTSVNTTLSVGDKIYIHQGVNITSSGGGYTSSPTISPIGGQTGNLYTWDETGRGDMYQMYWKVTLTSPETVGQQFNYHTGTKSIDELINHKVYLPYSGKYTVELMVYDTDNNFINEIKTDYIEAFLPEATFSYVTRYVSDCADTWDEFFQEPIPDFVPTANVLAPAPIEGIRYDWDNAGGRWVNPVFTDTIWDDSLIKWEHLEVGNTSKINDYKLPSTLSIDILEVSPVDNLEGDVIGYTDNTTFPNVTSSPTITVRGQRLHPKLEPGVLSQYPWIFIRRDDVIYQLEVLFADYSTATETSFQLTATPPEAFRKSPQTWEVLREIGGTVVFKGNQIYDAITNPTGIRIGEYIRLVNTEPNPKRKRVGIKAKDTYSLYPNKITLEGGGTDPVYIEGGQLGQIYKFRGNNSLNGNLVWNTSASSSTWVIEPSESNDPETRDHIGKIYILNSSCTPANPTNEIRPGFTEINLFVELNGDIVYNQRLRTKYAYFDTSSTGHSFDIWGQTGVHIIDITTLDGGSLDGLINYLSTQDGLGANIWIEYEYNIFPTRSYAGVTVGADSLITMDFNMYPADGDFINATVGQFPASSVNDTGWYYDHGIASGDYSVPVINTGTWRNGNGTIITVNDTESELLKSDSSYLGSQLDFPEDAAEQHLGTMVQNWSNSRALKWTDTCAHTWDMLDYQSGLSCNFKITQVSQNGSIQFNNDNTFLFQGIVGGMTNAQRFSQALYELRNSDNSGIQKFNYQVGSNTGDCNYIVGQLDTYNFPDTILNFGNYGSPTPVAGDVIVGEYLGPAATVSSVTTDIVMTANLPKKLDFIGESTLGSFYIKNITGLLEKDIYVGEIITSDYLPIAPAAPAQVLEIVAVSGQVRQLRLSEASNNTGVNLTFNVEWFTPSTNLVSFQHLIEAGTFSIDALAKTPSTDNLGWLISQNGTTIYDWDTELSVSIAHTYPIRNVINNFGYGVGKIGGFEGGLAEFLKSERSLQVYYFEGLSPLGNIGWYPALQLPPHYSFDSDPVFNNVKDAEVQSNRLPYESAIGGAWKWEETYIGIQPTKVPSGASILLSSDASQIAGKTNFSWKLYDNTGIIVEIVNPTFMWTFNQPGLYTVELEIADSNGNKKSYMKKDFFDIYDAT